MFERILGAFFIFASLCAMQMYPGTDWPTVVTRAALAVLGVSFIAQGWRSDRES